LIIWNVPDAEWQMFTFGAGLAAAAPTNPKINSMLESSTIVERQPVPVLLRSAMRHLLPSL
jgi:hypothetical protein